MAEQDHTVETPSHHRIALATTDRETIFKHFGQAEAYHIVDIDGENYEYAEVRKVNPPCNSGNHDVAAFAAVLDTISDCEAVVVGKIGQGAAEYLLRHDMRIFEGAGTVSVVLGDIISGKLLDRS